MRCAITATFYDAISSIPIIPHYKIMPRTVVTSVADSVLHPCHLITHLRFILVVLGRRPVPAISFPRQAAEGSFHSGFGILIMQPLSPLYSIKRSQQRV